MMNSAMVIDALDIRACRKTHYSLSIDVLQDATDSTTD